MLPVEAVFISDLHLHPETPLIEARFNAFTEWAAKNTKAVYILGDFFHAWPGDDGGDPWSEAIAMRLKNLTQQGIVLYFMHGNRDFLLGRRFADAAGMIILTEPTVIQVGDEKILLAHGDVYCIKDKSHQRFRRFTRNRWFTQFFTRIPLKLRKKLVARVRQHSQTNRNKTPAEMDVEPQFMLRQMQKQQVATLIHGHTHKVGLSKYYYNSKEYKQYVLSDWDDSPTLLCYYKPTGFYFLKSDF